MKSPCLSCDLKDSSKDNPVCKDCDKRVEYVKAIDGIEPPTQMRIKEKPSADKLKKAELFIQQTCQEKCIDLADLKSRRYSGGIRSTRREIAHKLRYEYKMSLVEIGKLLNKTYQAVSLILNPKEANPALKLNKKSTTKKEDKIVLDIAPSNTETVSVSTHNKESEEEVRKIIYIDFKNFPKMYDGFSEIAAKNFRTLEGQVLFLINEELSKNG